MAGLVPINLLGWTLFPTNHTDKELSFTLSPKLHLLYESMSLVELDLKIIYHVYHNT